MVLKKTVLTSLVALVLLCLTSTGIYKLYCGNFDLRILKRSLEKTNRTAPIRVNFPKNYHATGRLFLPHSNIVEPFEIWFTSDYNRSRIDYYYGTDKTFQRADLGKHGVTLKVVPMYTEKDGNYIGCWKLEGHKGWPIIPQPIVPNMTYFKYAGEEVYMGTPTTRWEYRYMVFGLLNTHTLLVSKLDPVRPVRYEMKGYDSLMASYYDNYVLEYISFEDWKPDLEKFELPKDQWCYNWSHSLDSHFVSNPMGEFMSYGEDIVEEMYHVYKEHHNKIHDSEHEHVKRKHIFRHNMRYIRSINRQNLAYKLAPNHLVDLTDEEYDGHAGLSDDNNTDHKGGVHLEEHHELYSNMSTVLKTVEVPDELDWREYGAVTPVRGQGICGSCYALGAVGAVEGAYFMKTGRLVELSAQQVIDCSWGSGNHGCRGGWYNKALSWIYMNGVAKAKNYGPYLAQEGTCETLRIKERVKIDAFAFVPKYNNSALKRAIAKYGPACVSINQKPLSLKFYSWGIYDNPECDNSSTRHTVLVTGYGKENGVPYWLVKNSWSASWGIDGYIKLAWKNNICGVTKNPVVALFKHTTFQFPVKEKIGHVNPLDPNTMGRKVHAQHKPGFHSNVKGSSFLRKINTPSLLNSSPGNRNKTSNVKRKFRGNPLTHQSKIQRHEDMPKKTSTIPENKPSIYPSTETNSDDSVGLPTHSSALTQKKSLHPQKVDETVIKTVEISSPQVEPQTKTSIQYTAQEYPDRTAMKSSLPSNTEASELYTGYDVYREGKQNIAHYVTQGDDGIVAEQNSVYNIPEQIQNVVWDKQSSSIEPEYYYPSYDYNTYNNYPMEYGTKNGLFEPAIAGLNREYTGENVGEQNYLNSRQWLPTSQYRTRKVKGVRDRTIEVASLLNSQKPKKLLSVQDKQTIESTAQPTRTSTTRRKYLKKTVKSKPLPTSATKHIRHYAGKLQDIYDKLEEVIASGRLKKHRQLKKNHVLWGY